MIRNPPRPPNLSGGEPKFAVLGGNRFHRATCSWARFKEATISDPTFIEWAIRYDGKSPCKLCAPSID